MQRIGVGLASLRAAAAQMASRTFTNAAGGLIDTIVHVTHTRVHNCVLKGVGIRGWVICDNTRPALTRLVLSSGRRTVRATWSAIRTVSREREVGFGVKGNFAQTVAYVPALWHVVKTRLAFNRLRILQPTIRLPGLVMFAYTGTSTIIPPLPIAMRLKVRRREAAWPAPEGISMAIGHTSVSTNVCIHAGLKP